MSGGQALSADTVAALVSACATEDALATRLGRALSVLRAGLNARAAAIGLLLPEGLWLLARDGPLGDDAARGSAALELLGRWRLWLIPADAARDGALLQLGLHLFRRELERELEAGRVAQEAALRTAIAHELGNSLTPLLCHGSDLVTREACRLRLLLDLLRQLGGGRGGSPGLLTVGTFLERVRRVAQKIPGGVRMELEVAPAVAGRALGSEQRDLLPLLLRVVVALKGAPGGVCLSARMEGAALRLELTADLPEPPMLALDLPEIPGLRLFRELAPGRVRVAVGALRPPRVLVLGRPDSVQRLEGALAPLGVELVPARDAGQVALLLEEPAPTWTVLVEEGLQAEALALRRLILERRLGARAQVPLITLGSDLAPLHHQPGPDEVDLAQLLAR